MRDITTDELHLRLAQLEQQNQDLKRDLRAVHERYRLLQEYSMEASAILDAQGKYSYVTPSVKCLSGFTPEEFMGMDPMEWVHPDDLPIVAHAFAEGISQPGKPIMVRYRVRHKDGSWHMLETIGRNLLLEPNIAGFVFNSRDVTSRWQAEEALRTLALRVTQAQECERRRIATNLHDHVGQALAGARMALKALRDHLEAADLGARLDQIAHQLSEAIQYTRAVTADLSPPVLHELGLRAALEWLAQKTQQENGLAIEFTHDGHLLDLDADRDIVVFSIVRELLLNVVKHAQARKAAISFTTNGGADLRIRVEDDGVGFDDASVGPGAPGSEWGLFGIREQLRGLGGMLAIDSRPGRGTTAVVSVPLGMQGNATGAGAEGE